jgi:hypothetical protein
MKGPLTAVCRTKVNLSRLGARFMKEYKDLLGGCGGDSIFPPGLEVFLGDLT